MKKLLLLPFLFLIITEVNAQWTTDTLLNTMVRDQGSPLSPMMATSYNGFTYISWFENGVHGLELRMQYLDSSGNKMWAPDGIVISNYQQTTSTSHYDLKVDNDGNAIVAFQDERLGHLDVVVYKIDATGASMWGGSAGISLRDSLSAEGIGPMIGITGHNDVVVAWNCDSSARKWISCERLSYSGILQWSSHYRVIDTVTNKKYSRPKLLPLGSSDIQMIYVEEIGSFPGVTSTIYAQHIGASGNNIWPAPIQVSTKTIPYFFFHEPVYDGHDGFYIAFDSSNPINISLNDVYVQHVDSAGNLWSTTGTEADDDQNDQKLTGASCLVSATGEFWVVLRVLDAGQTLSGISLQKFDHTGNSLFGSTGKAIINKDPQLYDPKTLNDAYDGVIFSTIYGPFGNVHIMAEKVDYASTVLWSGQPVSICSANSNKNDLASGKMLFNNLVYVWQDDRNGYGVYAQNLNSNGTTGLSTGIQTPGTTVFSLSPNPSSSPVLTMKEGHHQITVSSLQGQKVFFANTRSTSYVLNNLTNLAAGMYFISVADDTEVQSIKWNKIN